MIVKRLRLPGWAAALLAFAAGAVDACTYLALFGLFVGQVTGSFVIIDVQLLDADPSAIIRTVAIPVFFSPASPPRSWWRWPTASARRCCWRSAARCW